MFRILIIIPLIMICLYYAEPVDAQNKQVVSEMIISSNDSIFNYSYVYNNQALPVAETKMLKNGANWQNISQTEWIFQYNLPAGQVERKWVNNHWDDAYRIIYQQNDSFVIEKYSTIENNIETEIRKIETSYANSLKSIQTEYTKINYNWQKNLTTRFFYAPNHLTDSTVVDVYQNDIVKISYRTNYLYNSDSTIKAIIVQEKNDTDLQYKNVSKSYYSYKLYNQQHSITALRSRKWNSKTAAWDNDTNLEYVYDNAGKLLEEISWQWNSMFWSPVFRYYYQYDTENKLANKSVSIPLFRDWRNTNSINYLREPNSQNLTIESVYGFWGGKAGDKLNAHISFAFNDQTIIRNAETIQLRYVPYVESVVNTIKESALIKVYPNPSHGIFYISNFKASSSSWELTGLNGRVLKNSNSNFNTAIIDISDMPTGIYLLNIKSATNNETHKIVKY